MGGRTPGSKLPASPPPLPRPDGGGQPWPCACAHGHKKNTNPTSPSCNCGISTVFSTSAPEEPVGKHNQIVEHLVNVLQHENLRGLLNSQAQVNCLCATTEMSTPCPRTRAETSQVSALSGHPPVLHNKGQDDLVQELRKHCLDLCLAQQRCGIDSLLHACNRGTMHTLSVSCHSGTSASRQGVFDLVDELQPAAVNTSTKPWRARAQSLPSAPYPHSAMNSSTTPRRARAQSLPTSP